MKRPNILWFISDDTGFDMLGHTGGPRVTPYIDGLAREGICCTGFHTCSPICTPSRYGYFTGKYPGRSETPRFIKRHPTDRHYDLGFENEILPGEANFGSVFQAAGYHTGVVGKYHIGGSRQALAGNTYAPDEDPCAPETASKLKADYAAMQAYFQKLGFDYADGLSWDNTDARPLRALQFHNLEWQTDHALRFLQAAASAEKPFALHFGFTTQHGPHHTTSMETSGLETEWGFLDEAPKVQAPRTSIFHRIRAAGYDPKNHLVAGAAWMDDAIGAVLRQLEALGLADNTIVIYSTDHGPGTRNGKFTCYQGGTHIPFFIRWPEKLQAGGVCDSLLQNVDFLPTLCSLAGITAPVGIDGRDRSGALTGRESAPEEEELYFELGRCRAVRTRRWKYVAFRHRANELKAMKEGRTAGAYRQVRDFGGDYPMHLYPHYWDADQLYDLEKDPQEQRNLLHTNGSPKRAEHAAVLADMRERLRKRLSSFKHPFPMEADPWTASEDYRRLTRVNNEDSSIYEIDWYKEGAW